MFNVLYLYNATQTYTSTVYEHIASFAKHSRHRSFFCHHDHATALDVDLSRFDAIAIHYSIRLPFDQISPAAAKAIEEFAGLKFLFIQDEYDHTHRAWYWIKLLGIQLVFTVVPQRGIAQAYPSSEFPGTRFITTLTGYVPDELNLKPDTTAPSQRALIVGYRGRPLPIRYGKLGMEKVSIGEIVKTYCDAHGVENDIAWSEESRIYGSRWYEFMGSCRSMLGSESGSNVFDWDGTLVERIAHFRRLNPQADDDEVYEKFVRPEEIDGFMNQVSPRVFEAIAARTILVLFEGDYSGVVKAGQHFIPLKKDGSNLAEVVRLLRDGAYVDAMAERAYQDVIASGRYSYQSIVSLVDDEIEVSHTVLGHHKKEIAPGYSGSSHTDRPTLIATLPIRTKPPVPPTVTMSQTIFGAHGSRDLATRLALYIWRKFPESVRISAKLRLKRLIGEG